jgi:hypothetical protein
VLYNAFLFSFGAACLGYSALLFSCFNDMRRLKLDVQYADSSAYNLCLVFLLSLIALFMTFVHACMQTST